MSSVASEHAVLSSRPHLQRGHADGAAREPATPFREWLDNAGPAPEPAPAKRRTRPEHAEHSDDAKPAADRSAETAPRAKDSIKDTGDGKAIKDTAEPEDVVAAAKDGAACMAETGKPGEATAEADTPTADVATQSKPDLDAPLALDAMFSDAEPPVTAPPIAAPNLAAGPSIAVALDVAVAPNAVAAEVAPQLAAIVPVAAPATKPAPVAGQRATTTPTDADAGSEADSPAAIETAGESTPVLKADQTKPDQQSAAPDKSVPAEKATQVEKLVPSEKAVQAAQAKPDQPASMPPVEDRKDVQPHDKQPADLRHAATKSPVKLDTDAPASRIADAAAVKASVDAMQPLGAMNSAHATSAAASTANIGTNTPTSAQPPAPAVPLAGLAVEIAALAQAGKHRFEIRLDPPELGRIDVRLDVDRDGHVTSRLVVDRVETLELLKRDAAELQRALQQAGLKTSDNALEFSLRQQSFARDETPAQRAAELIVPDDDPAPLEALRQGYGRLIGLGGGLDIRV